MFGRPFQLRGDEEKLAATCSKLFPEAAESRFDLLTSNKGHKKIAMFRGLLLELVTTY
jgi:hypothetical protein